MIPTVKQVNDAARALIGDTQVPGGQLWTDTFLLPHVQSACRQLLSYLSRNGSKTLRQTRYFNLPANTAVASPAGMGMMNFGRPEAIYERGIKATIPATVLQVNAPSGGVLQSVDLHASTPHGLNPGDQIVTFGFYMNAGVAAITDDINSEWTIDVLNPTDIRLNGCTAAEVAVGSAAGTPGIISTGSSAWPDTPVQQSYDIGGIQQQPNNAQLTGWMWQGGMFRFVPTTQARQLKITFHLSGDYPLSSSVGIDDSLDALATYAAGLAATAKAFRGKQQDLFMLAVGNPTGDTMRVAGGYFYNLVQAHIAPLNLTPVRLRGFRDSHRNTAPWPYGGLRQP